MAWPDQCRTLGLQGRQGVGDDRPSSFVFPPGEIHPFDRIECRGSRPKWPLKSGAVDLGEHQPWKRKCPGRDLGVTRREGRLNVKPTAETGSGAQVTEMSGYFDPGKHVRLCGLPGGAEGIKPMAIAGAVDLELFACRWG